METYLRGNGFSGIAHAGTLRPPQKKKVLGSNQNVGWFLRPRKKRRFGFLKISKD